VRLTISFSEFVWTGILYYTGLFQLINEPTHIHGNILDLLLTKIDDSIKLLEVHHSFLITLTLPLVLLSTVMFQQILYLLLTLQVTTLASVTTSCMLTLLSNSWYWNSIENNIVNAMKFILIKKHHSVQHPSWFTSDIRHCINHFPTLPCKQKSCSSTIQNKNKHWVWIQTDQCLFHYQ